MIEAIIYSPLGSYSDIIDPSEVKAVNVSPVTCDDKTVWSEVITKKGKVIIVEANPDDLRAQIAAALPPAPPAKSDGK